MKKPLAGLGQSQRKQKRRWTNNADGVQEYVLAPAFEYKNTKTTAQLTILLLVFSELVAKFCSNWVAYSSSGQRFEIDSNEPRGFVEAVRKQFACCVVFVTSFPINQVSRADASSNFSSLVSPCIVEEA
jgi:hypothetical protein